MNYNISFPEMDRLGLETIKLANFFPANQSYHPNFNASKSSFLDCFPFPIKVLLYDRTVFLDHLAVLQVFAFWPIYIGVEP